MTIKSTNATLGDRLIALAFAHAKLACLEQKIHMRVSPRFCKPGYRLPFVQPTRMSRFSGRIKQAVSEFGLG